MDIAGHRRNPYGRAGTAGKEVNDVIGYPMLTITIAKSPTGWSLTITIELM
ncbi:hypothetical protein [Methylobacterium currus]|uniref:hypothetical protein n=1 Tax=Methylobacterium currus TaxID=2051553 RepID=UPI0013DF4F9C|nr:hypothetical protein [Methylobacterium currus]